MNDVDAMIAMLSAENLALRSLLAGLLFELARRGHVGLISGAFACANVPLAGVMREDRPSSAQKMAADIILRQMRDEVLGTSETK